MRRQSCVAALVVAVIVTGSSWSASASATAPTRRGARLTVVAAFYPVASAAERVGGDAVRVTNLTPAGAEPHDLELTPKQRDLIEDARLVVVMGKGFQPAVEAAARQRDGATLQLLRRLPIDSAGKRIEEHEHEGKALAHEEEESDALDPHVWLDPSLMIDIVDEIAAALGKASPRRRATFAANAAQYGSELAALDEEFRSGLGNCRRRLIVTAHEAFGYLARAYGLRQEGVAGIAPDTEPDAKRIAQLTDLVRREGVTTIFTEELVSPRIADTLAREAGGLKTAVLNPLEGLTPNEVKAGADYASVMRTNLAKLRAALDCA